MSPEAAAAATPDAAAGSGMASARVADKPQEAASPSLPRTAKSPRLAQVARLMKNSSVANLSVGVHDFSVSGPADASNEASVSEAPSPAPTAASVGSDPGTVPHAPAIRAAGTGAPTATKHKQEHAPRPVGAALAAATSAASVPSMNDDNDDDSSWTRHIPAAMSRRSIARFATDDVDGHNGHHHGIASPSTATGSIVGSADAAPSEAAGATAPARASADPRLSLRPVMSSSASRRSLR